MALKTDKVLDVQFENVPQEMKDINCWVLWKVKETPKGYTKVPIQINGNYASSTDSKTWTTYEQVQEAHQRGTGDGIGIVLNNEHGLYVLDIDNTKEHGYYEEFKNATYCEYSPSGNGIHIYMLGNKPKRHKNESSDTALEFFSDVRFMTVTGHQCSDIDYVAELDTHIDKLIEKEFTPGADDITVDLAEPLEIDTPQHDLTQEEVMQAMAKSEHSEEISMLMQGDISNYDNDHSRADWALISHLAYWTARNEEMMFKIFAESGLYNVDRGKRRTPAQYDLYVKETIRKAVIKKQKVYQPHGAQFDFNFDFIENDSNTIEKILIQKGIEARKKLEEYNEKTGKTKRPRLTPRAVANIIKNVCAVINIDYGNADTNPFAIYNQKEGIYEISPKRHYRLYLCVDDTLTENQCKTVTHFLSSDINVETREQNQDTNLQVFKNGIYNKSDKKLMPFSSEYIFVSKIDTNYNPYAKEPIYPDWNFTQWITEEVAENDPEKLKMIWQIFANAVDANTSAKAAVFLYSDHSDSSKSTFGNLIWQLVGQTNSASIRIEDFDDNQYLWNAFGKAYVYGDENSSKAFLKNADNLKSLSSGDPVTAKLLYHNPISFVATPLVIQSMNNLPNFANFDDGVVNRLRILKFNHRYLGAKKNAKIKSEYIFDKRLHEYILLESLKYDSTHVIDSTESQLEKDILKEADPMFLFFEQVFSQLQGNKIPVKLLFKIYQQWHFTEMGQEPKLQQNTFTRQLKVYAKQTGYDYERKNKRVSRDEIPDDDMRIYKNWFKTDVSYFNGILDGNKQQPMFYKD